MRDRIPGTGSLGATGGGGGKTGWNRVNDRYMTQGKNNRHICNITNLLLCFLLFRLLFHSDTNTAAPTGCRLVWLVRVSSTERIRKGRGVEEK